MKCIQRHTIQCLVHCCSRPSWRPSANSSTPAGSHTISSPMILKLNYSSRWTLQSLRQHSNSWVNIHQRFVLGSRGTTYNSIPTLIPVERHNHSVWRRRSGVPLLVAGGRVWARIGAEASVTITAALMLRNREAKTEDLSVAMSSPSAPLLQTQAPKPTQFGCYYHSFSQSINQSLLLQIASRIMAASRDELLILL